MEQDPEQHMESSGSDELDRGFEVRVIGEPKGKGLFATRTFSAGDVLFEERPLVCCQFSWNAAYGYRACDFCMRPLETAEENVRRLSGNDKFTLPHPECCATNKIDHVTCPRCNIGYCSASCRDEAWQQYHMTLCIPPGDTNPEHPLVKLNEAWKEMHYPPETASILLLARMIAVVRQSADKEGAMNLFMEFCHRTVNKEEAIAHKLLGDRFQGQLETLRDLMSLALYGDDVKEWFTDGGFRTLVSLIGTNGQGVGTSALSTWANNCASLDLPENDKKALDDFIDTVYEDLDTESGGFLNNEGSALYPLQSACNHNCSPNVIAAFPNNNFVLVMTATTDIAPDEEICVSYLDECTLSRSRHSRIKLLRENYLFTCHCKKCEAQINDPDETSEDEDSAAEEDEDQN